MAQSSYYGQRGDWVKRAQQWLQSQGYNVGSAGIDGIWGNQTEAAYQAYLSKGGSADKAATTFQGYGGPAAKSSTTSTSSGSHDLSYYVQHPPADSPALEQYIRQNYPGLTPLMNVPEIKNLLLGAAYIKASDAQIEAAYRNTQYWKTHSTAQTSWATLSPEERQQKRLEVAKEMQGWLQSEYGVQGYKQKYGALRDMDFVNKYFSAVDGVASGTTSMAAWQVDQHNLAMKTPGTDAYALNIQHQQDMAQMLKRPQDMAEQIWQEAHKDYFINMSKQDALNWANQIVNGKSSMGELSDWERKQAAHLYPVYAEQINNGVKPGTLFGPALQTLGNELEMSPEQVIADPKLWGEITAQAAGQKAPFTAADWIGFARQQPEWKRTQNARQMTSDFSEKLLQRFGAIA